MVKNVKIAIILFLVIMCVQRDSGGQTKPLDNPTYEQIHSLYIKGSATVAPGKLILIGQIPTKEVAKARLLYRYSFDSKGLLGEGKPRSVTVSKSGNSDLEVSMFRGDVKQGPFKMSSQESYQGWSGKSFDADGRQTSDSHFDYQCRSIESTNYVICALTFFVDEKQNDLPKGLVAFDKKHFGFNVYSRSN